MSVVTPQTYRLKSGAMVIIRSAIEADATALIEITSEAMADGGFHITESDEFQLTPAQCAEWIRSHQEAPADLVLVGEVDEVVVGLLNFESNGPRRRLLHSGEFAMSVHADWREQGVGTALIEALLAWAQEHPQIERVNLTVLGTNRRAQHVYAKLGFIEEGRRLRALKLGPGHYVDEILMYQFVKPLDDAVGVE